MQSSALRYFFEVVRCKSIRAAAERLHIAPSAISRQIAKLEYGLKAQLFERQVSGLVLTEAGRILADYAAVSAKEVDRLRAAISDISELRRGHVVIATVEAMADDFLPRTLAAFQQKYPGITACINVVGTQDVADAVCKGDADIGIAFNLEGRAELKVRATFPQPLYAIVAPSNPCARLNTLSLANLNGLRVALPNFSFGIRVLVERVAKEAGCEMPCVLETNNLEMAKGLVRMSGAITFMPLTAVIRDIRAGTLVAVPMAERVLSTASIDIIVAAGRTLPRAAEALLADLSVATMPAEPPARAARRGNLSVAARATPSTQN